MGTKMYLQNNGPIQHTNHTGCQQSTSTEKKTLKLNKYCTTKSRRDDK